MIVKKNQVLQYIFFLFLHLYVLFIVKYAKIMIFEGFYEDYFRYVNIEAP